MAARNTVTVLGPGKAAIDMKWRPWIFLSVFSAQIGISQGELKPISNTRRVARRRHYLAPGSALDC
jgi:hypothetical protein